MKYTFKAMGGFAAFSLNPLVYFAFQTALLEAWYSSWPRTCGGQDGSYMKPPDLEAPAKTGAKD